MKQHFYKPLGFLFLCLAILGVLLPLLPGTPFLLLSAWFFARSSEKWHQRLLQHEVTGPMIRNWEEHRCMTRRAKAVAIVSMLVAGGFSVFFAVEQLWLKLFGAVLLGIGGSVVLSIKTCEECKK
ncbi:MAG: YbaN family protein [Pseudomonadota bacterium]